MSSRLDIRVPVDLKSRFEEVVRSQNKSMSDVIRDLIQMYVTMAENGLDVTKLVKETIEQGKEVSKYILVLKVSNRYSGCGWVYLWWTQIIKLFGDVELVELKYDNDRNMCEEQATVAIIPRSVPAIVAKYYEDEDPNISNYLAVYVFDGESWKAMKIDLGDRRLSFDTDMVLY